MRFSRKVALLAFIFIVAGCGTNNGPTPVFVQADASQTNVTVQVAGAAQPLQPPDSAQLNVGDGIQVDESGRALLRFSDFLTVEILRTGDLQVQELALDEQSALAVFGQNGGAFVNELEPGADGVARRVIVESDFAVITATGTRFMVVKEKNSPLEWLFGLDAGADDLTVQAKNDPSRSDPTIKGVIGGVARWIAPVGVPSAGVDYDSGAVNDWLAAVQRGEQVQEVGDVLWPQADARMSTKTMVDPLPMNIGIDMGGTTMTMAQESAFGPATYQLVDCNNDGIDDVRMENGLISLDFRTLLRRVRALDVTLMATGRSANGSVTVYDPAKETIERQSFEIAPDQGQIVSLRSQVPYHYAEIAIANGCFLGFSLTPPGDETSRTKPVPAVDTWPPVVQTTQPTPTPTPTLIPTATPPVNTEPTPPPPAYRTGGALSAPYSIMDVDGSPSDWQAIRQQREDSGSIFDTIVFDQGCGRRYPDTGYDLDDLRGQVLFAYDDDYLYVAFAVLDDGFVGYTGTNLYFFQSDSPQLLLDLDLNGDAYKTTQDGDDKQIDFRVGIEEVGDNPGVAFWDLGPGTAQVRSLDAPIAVEPIDGGYFLEAAIPWESLGLTPFDGLRLGLAASVSDNDTPSTNVQECMISTAPDRDWQNPTTWGTLTLAAR